MLVEKRCGILPAGGLGGYPPVSNFPHDWGIQGSGFRLGGRNDIAYLVTGLIIQISFWERGLYVNGS